MKCNAFFDDMDRFLGQFAGRKIVFCPNPGNAGDSIIAAATLQLFERHRIQVEWTLADAVLAAGKVIFFGGGGNWVPAYEDCATFVAANHQQAERLVVLPHTVAGQEELLGTLGQNVDLFLREPISFDHCRSFAAGANVHLAEDLALELDVDRVVAAASELPRNFQIESLRAKRKKRVKRLFLQHAFAQCVTPWKVDHLSAFRTDREALVHGLERSGNLDVSDIFMYRTESPEAVLLAANHLIRYLKPYRSVSTDRLHVAITSALMGKSVKFYPNSYFKNESIYYHSLRSRFPKMEWMGTQRVEL